MNKLNKLIILLVCLLLVSGCVKNTNTVTIDKNKKMTYETEILLSDELNSNVEELINKDVLKNRKFKISSSKYDGYTGVTISKEFKNIDDLSTNKSKEIIMSDFLNKDFKEKDIFKREKGFFKDTYTAKFKYTLKESDYENLLVKKEEPKTTSDSEVKPRENDLAPLENVEEDLSELNKKAKLESEIEVLFKLKIPYESLSNNATEISDDGKILTWKVDTNGDTAISFAFYLLNWTHIFIVGGIALVILIGLIIFIITLLKKKANKSTLIHIDYDESIASKVENEVINNSGDLDVTLSGDKPEEQK